LAFFIYSELLFKNDKTIVIRGTRQSHLHHIIASGITKSPCGEANSSRSSAGYEFALSFLLVLRKASNIPSYKYPLSSYPLPVSPQAIIAVCEDTNSRFKLSELEFWEFVEFLEFGEFFNSIN